MEATLIKDAKVLVPNNEHKNFTESNEVIPQGTKVNGKIELINGLRRGEPFTYRVFKLNNNKLIFLNNLDMPTEVYMGADSQQTSAKVDLIPAEVFNKVRTSGLIIGGLAGFAYAKYQKHDTKKMAMWIGVGALLGFATAYVIDTNRKVIIKPSK